MNILITSKDDHHTFIGGDKRVSLILAKEWKKMGHNVSFVLHSISQNSPTEIEGICQYILPDHSEINTPQNLNALRNLLIIKKIDVILQSHILLAGFVELCSNVRDLAKVVSVFHFDIEFKEKVLAQSFFISWKNGLSLKRHAMDVLLWIKFNIVTRRALRQKMIDLYREVLTSSDKVVLLSKQMADDFCKRTLCQKGKVMFIPNPALLPQNVLFMKKEKMVVWVGTLDYAAKRVDRMLKIWSKVVRTHKDWFLKILGYGDWNYWRKKIKEYGIDNVEIVGFCDPKPYYMKSSIVCMTSTSESWGMVLVEGQSYGCAVMAFDSYVSASDIIDNGCSGILISPFDIEEYTLKLSNLMQNEELRERMAFNGMDSVKRYDSCLVAQQWIDLFVSLNNQTNSI